MITGRSGTLGKAFARICERRGLHFVLLSRSEMDVADPESVEEALDQFSPWAVVNTAGYVRVADAEREHDRCMRENTEGATVLARAASKLKLPLATFSSDLVFDGQLNRPYLESDPTNPKCIYGLSKAKAESQVLEAHPAALIVRTSAFFGPWDRYNFAWAVLAALREKRPFLAASGLHVSPTYVPDLVDTTLDLLIDQATGIWHVANDGHLTWREFAQRVARVTGLDETLVQDAGSNQTGMTAIRSERGVRLPGLDEAIERYVRELSVAA
ncbi:MAG TPA: SDR family oxidoreductase [Hyphomicrobiaceae bacterium]|nr:SDR family oxidoreductase [Hyphomicrobiaceae bacterium]